MLRKQLKRIETVILVPGVPGNSPRHWQGWLARQCMDHGLKAVYPQLDPERNDLRLPVWLEALERVVSCISGFDKTAFVGHSLGCMTILQLLGRRTPTCEVGMVILVSPSSLSRADINVPGCKSFFDGLTTSGAKLDTLDAAKIDMMRMRIRAAHIFAADNDALVDEGEARALATNLGAIFHLIPGAGHMGDSSGTTTFPEIFELLTVT